MYRAATWLTIGLSNFTKGGYLSAAKNFTKDALDVDLTGGVYMVTGANSGIGEEVTKALLHRGGEIHMICRSKERGEASRQALIDSVAPPEARPGAASRLHLHILDLTSISDTKAFAAQFSDSGQHLNGLVNNAGCMVNERTITPEGFEANFACNTLGTFALTEGLIPALTRASKHKHGSRVVTVSSGGMLTVDLDTSDFNHAKLTKFDGTMVYAQNKRAQVCLTERWADLYGAGKNDIVFQSYHPGWADTPAVRTSMPGFHKKMEKRLRTQEEGADTCTWLLASQEALKQPPGNFFLDRAPQSKHLPWPVNSSYTKQQVVGLWTKLSELMAKVVVTEESLAKYAYLGKQPLVLSPDSDGVANQPSSSSSSSSSSSD